jgi:cysteine desulfurase family protein (TIGR01976 family)
MSLAEHVSGLRGQFPALGRGQGDRPFVYLDGPAGTQVPVRVADSMSAMLLTHNANRGGVFATSLESDERLAAAQSAMADFLGTADPDCIAWGQNMTSLTFQLAATLGRTWQPGDEIVLTRIEHDANFTPWIKAAERNGVTVRYLDIHEDDCTLAIETLPDLLNQKTRLVAVGCASNAVGTINPIRTIIEAAHSVGAFVFLDAVHFAPHALMSVDAWGCDFLACSAYKFCGPHVGMLYGRREHLERLAVDKLRPSPNTLPSRWMTGTQSHESIVGAAAAVDYFADLGRLVSAQPKATRRAALEAAFVAITDYEQSLCRQLLHGLRSLPRYRVWGIRDEKRLAERFATVAITHEKYPSRDVAQHLARAGIFAWHGNYYALPLTERLGLEPAGMTRLGLVHYNTAEEVDRTLEALASLD